MSPYYLSNYLGGRSTVAFAEFEGAVSLMRKVIGARTKLYCEAGSIKKPPRWAALKSSFNSVTEVIDDVEQ